MVEVIVVDTIDDNGNYVCGLCKSTFSEQDKFSDHTEDCAPVALMKFPHRDNLSLSEYSIANNAKILRSWSINEKIPKSASNSKKSYTCDICGRQYITMLGLGKHKKFHDLKVFQCQICGKCFFQRLFLQRHILTHKVWPENVNECSIDTESLIDSLPPEFQSLMKLDIMNQSQIIASEQIDQYTSLLPEQENVNKAIEAEKDSALFKKQVFYSCPYCKLSFENYNLLKSHLKSHSKLKKFKCIQDACSNYYEFIDDLLNHVTVDHFVTIYSCFVCNLKFNFLENVRNHQISHNFRDTSTVPSYKCTLCDATYKKMETLTLHMLTDDHKKKCFVCKKTFPSDLKLKWHLMIHERDMKLYQCNICKKYFNTKRFLIIHEKEHGKGNNNCSLCGSVFQRADQLGRHLKLHEQNKLTQCTYCNRQYTRIDKLLKHIESHTKSKT